MPAERMKAKREHRVPLSKGTLEVLAGSRRVRVPDPKRTPLPVIRWGGRGLGVDRLGADGICDGSVPVNAAGA